MTRLMLLILLFGCLTGPARSANTAVYQYSVPLAGEAPARAFLWIPPGCQRVRAVVVGQNNMIEQGIFAHPKFRRTLAELDIGEVWITPSFDGVFRFDRGAGERFDAMMNALAAESGYGELRFAPVAPLGHSACASYPWNFAAWNPARTLAILSVHGDAPLTKLTGSGKPNPDWGDRKIDGVPGLMVMGEYEWGDDRLAPALAYCRGHPRAPIAMLAEIGRGHFDYSDDLVTFLAMFIRKAAKERLPANAPLDEPPVLKPIDPSTGWLSQRWRLRQPRTVLPAPVDKYTGDPAEAFWCFDQEMAEAIQNYRAGQLGKKPQLLGFVQDGKTLPQTNTHEQVSLRFEPDPDGVTFRLQTTFLATVESGSNNLPRWTDLLVGTPLGHAAGGGPIVISRITGPATKTGDETFVYSLDRDTMPNDQRVGDIWFLANQEGDGEYKSAVQQALMRVRLDLSGEGPRVDFPVIADQPKTVRSLKLEGTDGAGQPTHYYVREGPAEIDGDILRFTDIPPRSRFPLRVTVVAWQWAAPDKDGSRPVTLVDRAFHLVE